MKNATLPSTAKPLHAKGYGEASWISRLFFSYVNPLLDAAATRPLEEYDAKWQTPSSDEAHKLAADFQRVYEDIKGSYTPPPPPSHTSTTAASAGGGGDGAGSKAAPGRTPHRSPSRPWMTLTGQTFLRLYRWPMVLESLWVLIEVGQRLGTPVALRQFLRWLQSYASGSPVPQWEGWMWAVVLGACGYSMVIIHHQLFWIGIRAGFTMRQQAIAAIHAKVLRLNSAAVGALSTGHVVNLVSNDVRRFDDVMPFWIFLWAAPLELAIVLLMVSLELDFVSALAGVATSLAMIPLQSVLVRYIGGLRRNTARCTDERVRLAGEVVEGALAMKMLSWEDPFTDALRTIRGRETHFSRRMQRIRGINFALQFAITPIVSFVTFAVFRARNGSLNVASVFYSLSLLHLPKLYMVNFFVLAVQSLTELRVSLQRIDAFLSTPEPSAPANAKHNHRDQQQEEQQDAQKNARHQEGPFAANGQTNHHQPATTTTTTPTQPPTAAAASGRFPTAPYPAGAVTEGSTAGEGLQLATRGGGGESGGGGEVGQPMRPNDGDGDGGQWGGKEPLPEGYVAMGGADYDWNRPFGRDDVLLHDTHGTALGGAGGGGSSNKTEQQPPLPPPTTTTQSSKMLSTGRNGSGDGHKDDGDGGSTAGGLTLYGIRFAASPGELLGVCGAVGAGKSSLLGALLGELQPLEGGPQAVGGAGVGGKGIARSNEDEGSGGKELVEVVLAGYGGGEDEGASGALAGPAAAATTNAVKRGGGGGGGAWGGPVVRGRVAYCAQIPWIVAGTVRDNVVFGAPWDPEWYDRVLTSCCLREDLAGLPAGDETELGERGVNLSGGQKARVALARACYARPAVALLDDPLSAVDPRVGRELFAAAIGPRSLLAECGATRLLVTHQRQYLPQCDRVLVLRGGRLLALAPWRQLVGLRLPELTAGHGGFGAAGGDGGGGGEDEEEEDEEEGTTDGVVVLEKVTVDEVLEQVGGGAVPGGEGPVKGGEKTEEQQQQQGVAGGRVDTLSAQQALPPPPGAAGAASLRADEAGEGVSGGGDGAGGANGGNDKGSEPQDGAVAGSSTAGALVRSDAAGGKLVQSEDRVTGTVSWSVYGSYCRHLGLGAAGLIGLALFSGQGVFLASEWWLALWSRADPLEQGEDRWLWVYGMLTAVVIVLAFVRSALFFEATLSSATSIHNAMAHRVLRAPLSFFHSNPSGRIVNRFSKDQGQVDDLLPSCLFDALQSAFLVFGAFVLVAIAVPVILPVFVPLAVAFWWIRRRYITASREVKRWEAVTRSPVYASFSATLKGLPTIRAYGASDRFHDEFLKLMTLNGHWYFAFMSTSRWIGVRLDAVAGTTLLASTLLAMAMRDHINTGVMALALTHVLQLTGFMQWVVRQSAEAENTMTCVERMLAYTQLDSEPPRVADGAPAPPPGWPRSGALTYQEVTAVYRPGLPPVLCDISFKLAPGTSCGVVGRTGSGKSSLMLTLFRLITVTGGRILLDGVDTAAVGLDALRRQLAIIPQDPVLFSGTLRSNLDPWRSYDDTALWGVLEAVQLRAAVAAMPGGLDGAMSECGGNLSVGQRQLFCLARALLQDAKVLALDEATANVDRATDELIQRALRDFAHRDREHHGRVLLVIAHRIDTILDTDHLLVLSGGRLVESGSPGELAAGEGVFGRMVAAARLAGGAGGAAGLEGAAVAQQKVLENVK